LKLEARRGYHMKRRHLFLVLAIFMVSFFLPYHIGTAEEEEGKLPKPWIETTFPRAAKPGDQVTIRGRRFGTEQGEVIFTPEAKAEIANWTVHRIWVIVPESATSGPVFIRRLDGSESNKEYFTVQK
jgi:hypothetical protein